MAGHDLHLGSAEARQGAVFHQHSIHEKAPISLSAKLLLGGGGSHTSGFTVLELLGVASDLSQHRPATSSPSLHNCLLKSISAAVYICLFQGGKQMTVMDGRRGVC